MTVLTERKEQICLELIKLSQNLRYQKQEKLRNQCQICNLTLGPRKPKEDEVERKVKHISELTDFGVTVHPMEKVVRSLGWKILVHIDNFQ